jgi:Raf kinase inhibitor-like YbhB/YbcL family protein
MTKKHFTLFLLLILLCGVGTICIAQKGDGKMTIVVTSDAFKEGGMIPAEYTCDGKNISPPIKWQQVPKDAKSFALISDDPDAPIGIWVHWVMWNIPSDVNSLAQAIPTVKELQNGTKQGINDFQQHGYGGPCPPGGTHRYYFKVYALDTMLDLPDRATKKDLVAEMKNHIIAEGSLMGKYQRK